VANKHHQVEIEASGGWRALLDVMWPTKRLSLMVGAAFGERLGPSQTQNSPRRAPMN